MSQAIEECSLSDVLITGQLGSRTTRAPNLSAENRAFHSLARSFGQRPDDILQHLVTLSLDLCNAGTSGISLAEEKNQEPVFRWSNLAGRLHCHVGVSTPRHFSTCGVTLDEGRTQLFRHPGRFFEYFQSLESPVVEGLIVPFYRYEGYEPLGTIWVLSHHETTRFDVEDARLMESFAGFAAFAVKLLQAGQQTNGTSAHRTGV